MMVDPFDKRISEIFKRHEARSEQHSAWLKESGDLIAIILKGHLVVEELITVGIEAHCCDVDQLGAANFRFVQRVALLRALEKVQSAPPEFWEAVLRLNKLRNELAHSRDHSRVPKLSKAFVSSLESYSTTMRFPRPLDGREALIQALHFLIGGLEVVAVWQASTQEVIMERLQKLNQHELQADVNE